jgi:hypothetical protein
MVQPRNGLVRSIGLTVTRSRRNGVGSPCLAWDALTPLIGENFVSSGAADDFTAIRLRLRELRGEVSMQEERRRSVTRGTSSTPHFGYRMSWRRAAVIEAEPAERERGTGLMAGTGKDFPDTKCTCKDCAPNGGDLTGQCDSVCKDKTGLRQRQRTIRLLQEERHSRDERQGESQAEVIDVRAVVHPSGETAQSGSNVIETRATSFGS